ncbi:serine threonine protein kinase [Stylonychia lemnae]|uniref:Serine threonine protein kinase n=1 Tax=Stylonychia lemnae TaxID=5949 RepID=A0A078ALT9_STYLE|nr:serine threonine protein kinase [Stylonychia lemnae]|eukprot:CDW83189.1 serine threonine protein kinase [Stylonychia lemnae]
MVQKLGFGANAVVFKVERNDESFSQKIKTQNKYFALKVMRKNKIVGKQCIEQIKDEISAHRALSQCTSSLKLHKVYETPRKLYLLLDYMNGGNLSSFIEKSNNVQDCDIKSIMEQLLLGMHFIHQLNIVHRDLKLDNILLNTNEFGKYEIKIADFGLAVSLKQSEKIFKKCGTPTYIAPEILRGEELTLKADMFSLGSIMYNLCTGQYLFDLVDSDQLVIINQKCDLSHVPTKIKHMPAICQDLILRLLNTDPQKRIDCKQALSHQWFRDDHQAIENLTFTQKILGHTFKKKQIKLEKILMISNILVSLIKNGVKLKNIVKIKEVAI